MNSNLLKIALLSIVTLAIGAAEPREEVKAAIEKLSKAGGYTWTATPKVGENSRFRGGPSSGKVDKDGVMHVTVTRGDNSYEIVGKGDKRALKSGDAGWQTSADLESGGENRGRFMARTVTAMQPPAEEAQKLLTNIKTLTKEGDAYKGEFTEAGVKEMLSFGRRNSNGGPEVSGAKGSATFWVKDGVLSKYEHNVQGSMTFNNNDVQIDRTTTVEIKDAGKTTVTIPEEAKKKIS